MLRLPLHDWHVAHGARMRELHGWKVPASYPKEPNGLALADLSAFAKVSLRGSGVSELAQAFLKDTGAARPQGVATLPGNILSCRLTDDHLLLLGDAPRLEVDLGGVELRLSALDLDLPQSSARVVAVNATCAYAEFALMGGPIEEMLTTG